MQINIEDFDNVVGGLTALINVLSNRLRDEQEKLSRAKVWEEELQKEIHTLREQIRKGLVQKMAKTKKAKKEVTYILEEGHNFFNAKAKSV